MPEKFEVSFNSPQCGWMSVGFRAGDREFHTTTAHSPHENALSELLLILTELTGDGDCRRVLKWNRDPEEFDIVFEKKADSVSIEIVEYPTAERDLSEAEIVFRHTARAKEIGEAFLVTFEQLYAERDADEFEENWHQPFPLAEFQKFRNDVRGGVPGQH